MEELVESLTNDFDNLQTQIYVMSGVVGGLLFALVVTVIVLIVQFTKIHRRMTHDAQRAATTNQDDLARRGFSAYTAKSEAGDAMPPPVNTRSLSPLPQQRPYNPPVNQPAFSYDNTGYNDIQLQQRPIVRNQMHNGNGVQVLPKNPPPQRFQNDAFY